MNETGAVNNLVLMSKIVLSIAVVLAKGQWRDN